jgi:hypothetical protein
MNEITYKVDFVVRGRRGRAHRGTERKPAAGPIPRIARLMALAIRLDGLVRNQSIDYAEVARRGLVTRARMTQIMQLLDLAPDLQEWILFLPPGADLKERNLRPIVRCLDWDEQRHLFEQLIGSERKVPAAVGRHRGSVSRN